MSKPYTLWAGAVTCVRVHCWSSCVKCECEFEAVSILRLRAFDNIRIFQAHPPFSTAVDVLIKIYDDCSVLQNFNAQLYHADHGAQS